MKNILLLLASLSLGFMATSCQNDIDEVINVNDEIAATRAIDEEADESSEDVAARSSLNLTGPTIIYGTTSQSYSTAGYSLVDYKPIWEYGSYLTRTDTGGNSTTASFKLNVSNYTGTTYIKAKLQNRTTGDIDFIVRKNIDCNGPAYGTSSVRVVRSSDGVEVFPASVGLSPNNWYYAYFSNTEVSNMTLNWDFNHATVISQSGYTVYFKTDNYGYSLLTVSGKMPGSSTFKEMLGVTLYGGGSKSGKKSLDISAENNEEQDCDDESK